MADFKARVAGAIIGSYGGGSLQRLCIICLRLPCGNGSEADISFNYTYWGAITSNMNPYPLWP